jgi:RNAse (barnase) inhibitor barstar
MMKDYFIYELPPSDYGKEVVRLTLDSSFTEELLYTAYDETLRFPYFGRNWDALLDVLGCLYDIDEYEIQIVHTELPNLSDDDMRIYIEILYDVCDKWEKWNAAYDAHSAKLEEVYEGWEDVPIKHLFRVFFNASCKEIVEAILTQYATSSRIERTYWWQLEQ